jgi:hypothetical protein
LLLGLWCFHHTWLSSRSLLFIRLELHDTWLLGAHSPNVMESMADERLCQPVTEDPIAVATALAATRPVEQEIEEIETEQMETEQTGAAPPRMSVADATQTELAAGAPHEVSAEVLAWQVDVGARLTKLASTAVDAALAPVRAGALYLEATWPCAKCASTHNRLWRSCAICGEPMPLSEVIVSTLPLYPPTSLHLLHHPRPPHASSCSSSSSSSSSSSLRPSPHHLLRPSRSRRWRA